MSPSNVKEPIFDVETERRAPSAYLRLHHAASTRRQGTRRRRPVMLNNVTRATVDLVRQPPLFSGPRKDIAC